MVRQYRYDLGFAINGTPIPDPAGFSGALSTLDTFAERDLNGKLHRNPVAKKNPTKLSYQNIDWGMIKQIIRLAKDSEAFQFTYPDPTTGGASTRECYAGDATWSAVWMPSSGYIGNLDFSVIEY